MLGLTTAVPDHATRSRSPSDEERASSSIYGSIAPRSFKCGEVHVGDDDLSRLWLAAALLRPRSSPAPFTAGLASL
jgi:hypothetical protein